MHKIANVFNNRESDHHAVAEAGNQSFMKLYRTPSRATFLNTLQ